MKGETENQAQHVFCLLTIKRFHIRIQNALEINSNERMSDTTEVKIQALIEATKIFLKTSYKAKCLKEHWLLKTFYYLWGFC